MFRHWIFFLFAAAATLTGAAQSDTDTLTAGVFPPNATVLKGATRDLANLDIRLITLRASQSFHIPNDSADHLLIVKDGAVNIEPTDKTLGPGGVGLFAGMSTPRLYNSGKTSARFYLFSFKSRTVPDYTRYKQAPSGSAFLEDWPALVVKPSPKGESRAIFSQPVTWLKNINMHATTLNPGEISHPQHMHRAEEILLLRSGNVRMHIAGGYIPAKGGDLVFLPSGVPHDLENGKAGKAEYFALQWER
jgi:quercetin dioxygenase-like cupin family protein